MRNGALLLIHGVEPGVWSHQLMLGREIAGRSRKCHIRLADPTVSRIHAEIEWRATGLFIRDLGSTNGTFVNERPVRGDLPSRFTRGDLIRVGRVVLNVLAGSADAPTLLEQQDYDSTPQRLCDDGIADVVADGELTDRDKEILALLLRGKSEKQVAFSLGIEHCTVHEHVGRIYEVYGVHSRAQLLSRLLGNNHVHSGPP